MFHLLLSLVCSFILSRYYLLYSTFLTGDKPVLQRSVVLVIDLSALAYWFDYRAGPQFAVLTGRLTSARADCLEIDVLVFR